MILNENIIYGRLVKDPKIITTDTYKIANFSLAIPKRIKKDNVYVQSAAYVECKCFNKQAETIEKFFKKGSAIVIKGSLDNDSWIDPETNKNKTKVFILVEKISFPSDNRKPAEGGSAPAEPAAKTNKPEVEVEAELPDNIPF